MNDEQSGCVGGVKPRGSIYWMRRRVPAEFASVETRSVVEVSLRTRDPAEAQARAYYRWEALKKGWKAAAAYKRGAATPETFDAMHELLGELDLPYLPMTALISGPIEKLVSRIEAIANAAPASPWCCRERGGV